MFTDLKSIPGSDTASRKTPALGSLTTFRFFAAAAIVVFHTVATHDIFLRSGVSFFYILSGFILVYVHPHLEGRKQAFKFWIARWARIWPLHVVTFLIVLVGPFGMLLQKGFLAGVVLNLALLQSWVPIGRVALSFNGVSWSLSVEALFYLLFPFLLRVVQRRPVATVLLALSLKVILSVVGIFLLPETSLGHTPAYETFEVFNPAMHIYKFVFGMALAFWWRSQPLVLENSRRWTSLEAISVASILLLIPIFSVVIKALLPLQDKYFFGEQVEEFICVPLFGFLLCVFAFQRGKLSSFFSHGWLVYLGEISFSVYMTHGFVIWYFKKCFPFGHPHIEVVLFIACVLALSSFLFEVIEKPCRKALNRFGTSLIAKIA